MYLIEILDGILKGKVLKIEQVLPVIRVSVKEDFIPDYTKQSKIDPSEISEVDVIEYELLGYGKITGIPKYQERYF